MNRWNTYWFFVIFILLSNIMYSQEYRAEAEFSYEKRDVEVGLEMQGRRSFEDNSYANALLGQFSAKYKLSNRFDIGSSLRYAVSGKPTGGSINSIDYNNKTRVTFDFGANFKRFENELKLKSRLRYQTNIDNERNTKCYLREKITIDYKLSDIYKPYTAIEIYYQLQRNELKAYRLYLGSEFDLDKHKLDFYYIIEASFSSQTDLFYMLGLSYNFEL